MQQALDFKLFSLWLSSVGANSFSGVVDCALADDNVGRVEMVTSDHEHDDSQGFFLFESCTYRNDHSYSIMLEGVPCSKNPDDSCSDY